MCHNKTVLMILGYEANFASNVCSYSIINIQIEKLSKTNEQLYSINIQKNKDIEIV